MATHTAEARLYRRREAASVLAVSESQVLKWERIGWLTPIRLPGIRAVRYDAEQVGELAQRFTAQVRRRADPACPAVV